MTAAAFGFPRVAQDALTVNLLMGFGEESQASRALSEVEREGIRLGSLVPRQLVNGQEGPLLAVRLIVDIAQVAQVFKTLEAPQ